MRVAIVGSVLGFGGVEQHMLNLAIGLRRIGHEPYVIGLVNAGGFDLLREWADPERRIPVTWLDGEGDDGLRRALEVLRPDMLSAQLPFPGLPLEGVSIPMVWTAHGRYSLNAPPPRPGPIICMDGRVADAARGLTMGGATTTIWNGIDLERFKFSGDVSREGIAYVGRWDPPKLAGLGQLRVKGQVDVFGADGLPSEAEQVRNCRAWARPEIVYWGYRVVIAGGLCAVEAMACGALLLMPELNPQGTVLDSLANTSFSPMTHYSGAHDPNADLARLLALERDGVDELQSWQRRWAQTHHDCIDMARRFADVYEVALCESS